MTVTIILAFPIFLLILLIGVASGVIINKPKLWISSLTGFLILLSCILYVVASIFGFIFTPFDTSLSPNETNKIQIKTNGPRWPFGSEDVHIKARIHHKQKTYKTSIANDGKALSSENIQVIWISDEHAEIRLDGEEQNLEILDISFQNKEVVIQQKETSKKGVIP